MTTRTTTTTPTTTPPVTRCSGSVYLMTDCIIFAGLFAAFAVLRGEVAGGPSGKELFELNYVRSRPSCCCSRA